MDTKYLLHSVTNWTEKINETIRESQRIKFISFDISDNYIILGASSGSIYLYTKNDCKLITIVPSTYGGIHLVKISPNESYVAMATIRGFFCILPLYDASQMLLKLSSEAQSFFNQRTKPELQTQISCLHWRFNEKEIYYGDVNGNVNVATISHFMRRNIVNISSSCILQLDGPIIQIDCYYPLLLIAGSTSNYLCNVEIEKFCQIGTQTRNASNGACFVLPPKTSWNENFDYGTKIFCARQKFRFWLANLEGNVLQTQDYSQTIGKIVPSDIINLPESPTCNETDPIQINKDKKTTSKTHGNGPVELTHLQSLTDDNLILTYHASAFYLIDPMNSSLLLWCKHFNNIKFMKAIKNELYLLTNNNQFYKLMIDSVQNIVCQMIESGAMIQAGSYIKQELNYFHSLHIDKNISNCFDSLLTYYKRIKDNDGHKLSTEDELLYRCLQDKINEYQKLYNRSIKHLDHEDQDDYMDNREMDELEKEMQDAKVDEEIVERKPVKQQLINLETINQLGPSKYEKVAWSLYMISTSASISKVSMLERYKNILDEYDFRTIQEILNKLQYIMKENGVSENEVIFHSANLYLDYLSPNQISSMEQEDFQYVLEAFLNVNRKEEIACPSCNYLIIYHRDGKHETIGFQLVQWLLDHGWHQELSNLCKKLSFLYTICYLMGINIAGFNLQPKNLIRYGDIKLVASRSDMFSFEDWCHCFEELIAIHKGNVKCLHCESDVEHNVNITDGVTWDELLNLTLLSLSGRKTLSLISIYADHIPSEAVPQKLFLNCLLCP